MKIHVHMKTLNRICLYVLWLFHPIYSSHTLSADCCLRKSSGVVQCNPDVNGVWCRNETVSKNYIFNRLSNLSQNLRVNIWFDQVDGLNIRIYRCEIFNLILVLLVLCNVWIFIVQNRFSSAIHTPDLPNTLHPWPIRTKKHHAAIAVVRSFCTTVWRLYVYSGSYEHTHTLTCEFPSAFSVQYIHSQ